VDVANTNTPQPRARETQINTGIHGADRKEMAASLSHALAETYVLYLKTQGFHWNVVGPLFYGLHKLTEEQYKDLAAAVDELAERIRALGHPAPATFAEFLQMSQLKEMPGDSTTDEGLKALIADHETISRTFRKAVQVAEDDDDIVTADMLTDRMRSHENAAWMLRSIIAH
jgi:starvation-inducible DNA-binding protein